MQITDISQLGTPQQVAQLVLPRDVRMLNTAVSKTALPPKDTGTVLGVVEREPVTTYRRVSLCPCPRRVAARPMVLPCCSPLPCMSAGNNSRAQKRRHRIAASHHKLPLEL